MSSVQPEIIDAALNAKVDGRVQGVYFRAFVTRHAAALKLTGWVRNQPDGSVQVYAEGKRQKLDELLTNLKAGPPGARVDNLEVSWGEYSGKYHDFSVTG